MTRRSVLGLLGLPLAAQDDHIQTAPANTPQWEVTGKPKNGQCGNCGRQSQDHDTGVILEPKDPRDPIVWLNRCAKCNNAVFEDIEEAPNPRKAA